MENIMRKPGPRPKDPAKKKVTVSITLLPSEKNSIEAQAEALGITPSQLIVKKLKLF